MTALPDRAWHGTTDASPLAAGMPPAVSSSWYSRTSWRRFDRWMVGGPHLDEGLPYANVLWEALGLRDRPRLPDGVHPAFRSIRSHHELATRFGMLFVTDREEDARRYGDPHEIDLRSSSVVAVVEDPHVRTHAGWIAVVPVGATVPFLPPTGRSHGG